ncbi:unnamed protein product [Brugia timori]|uniref:Cytochrome b n=1 Tax=Brugia timori TaxID=42155 RepID=A0A0R3Q7G7_9BILA|nr:unnamed protein product [Brugia timori]
MWNIGKNNQITWYLSPMLGLTYHPQIKAKKTHN